MSVAIDIKDSAEWQNDLYRQYHRKVLNICLYYLKDREAAKDAAQDVFLKAFHAWKEFEWKCDPMTWIGTIAKHHCFSCMYKAKRNYDHCATLAYKEEMDNSGESDEATILHRLRLKKLLPTLSDSLQEILRLSLDQGLNHREISVAMKVSRVAISRRLMRFKKELVKQGIAQII